MYLDIFLIVVMLISGLLALVRGFIREVLSIAGWASAAGAALFAYVKVLPGIKSYFTMNEYVLTGLTLGVFFIGTLFIVSIITVKISDMSLNSRIGGPLDRTLGFLFGLARGLLIVVVMFAFYDWFQPKAQPEWIEHARSRAVLQWLRDDIISMSPDIEAWYSKFKKQKDGSAEPPA